MKILRRLVDDETGALVTVALSQAGVPLKVLLACAVLILLVGLDYALAAWACRTPTDAWGPVRAWLDWSAAKLGGGVVLGGAALALWLGGWLWRSRRWEVGGKWLFAAVLLAGFWSRLLKQLIGRPRPRMWTWTGEWLPHGPTVAASWESFPSGHAMTAFALVALLSALAPRGARLWLALAVFISVGRLIGADHYLTDTLVGALLGAVVGEYARSRWAAEVGHEAG
ncbi:MAG: phosphatase PAP2 family protein [Armatimonadetes bacterium]|nr:phosphatase PAP2 family protein [Armatimonadota bacterium]